MPSRELGEGLGTGWPEFLDTKQTYNNKSVTIPDGPTRPDAELFNDALAAILALQVELGTDPAGASVDVVTRLNLMPTAQATQAAIEAETDENTYVPPDLIKHFPGVAKAWAFVPIAGTSFTAQYNMSSVSKGGTGIYNYVIATDFSTANYAVIGSGISGGNAVWVNAIAAGTFGIQIKDSADSAANSAHMVASFGDQS